VIDKQDQLLGQLARRNWLILVVLVVLSLFLRDKNFTIGVLSGGLMAVCGYQWLHRSLVKVLSAAENPAIRGFQLSYVYRLAALVVVLVLSIAVFKVDTLGLIIGLSVVVINIMLTTVLSVIK
jgi:hypothetical protein